MRLPQHCIAFIRAQRASLVTEMPKLEEHQLEAQRAAGLREPKMNVCYVLRLGADPETGAHKYYVGSSCNFMNRLHNHVMGNYRSSAWVKRWKYEELVETRHCHDRLSALTTEVGLTVQHKARYGWDNVRGGQDTNSGSSRRSQPAYWEPPEEGLERQEGLERARRDRSRSPARGSAGD